MINMEKERKSVNDMLWEHTPADKLSTIFNVWINEELKNWFNDLATEEMDFMLERFQDTLEECINKYGKEV